MALLAVTTMPAVPSPQHSVAVLIPCLDEEHGIASVVAEFRRELPQARIVVVDNGSTDATARLAAQAGAEVWHEPRRGKGRAITTAFARLEEDVVVMVDGDGSYPAAGDHAAEARVHADARWIAADDWLRDLRGRIR